MSPNEQRIILSLAEEMQTCIEQSIRGVSFLEHARMPAELSVADLRLWVIALHALVTLTDEYGPTGIIQPPRKNPTWEEFMRGTTGPAEKG